MGRLRDTAAGLEPIDHAANALDYLSGSQDDEGSESEDDGEVYARQITSWKKPMESRQRSTMMDEGMSKADGRPVFNGEVYTVFANPTRFVPLC